VLPGLHELFLQGLRPEHCVAVPLDNSPSSTARPSALLPSDVLPPPGPQGRLPGVQPHHDYSWRLQTSLPSGLAPHLGFSANGRLLPGFTLAVHRHVLLRPSRGLLRSLLPPARGLLRRHLGSPAPSLQRALPRGWCFLRLRPLSTEDNWISHSWRLDYSLRITVFVQCTHLLQYWPLAM
jgi:hypothetical protein